MRLWAWGLSDPGRKRERNEDSYLVDPTTGVIAVADGMGGHQGGATASRMAVELLGRELGDCHGDYEGALARHISNAMRTTEQMEATDPDGNSFGSAPTLPNLAAMATLAGANIQLPRGDEPTIPAGSMFVFAPALEIMRRIVRRASAAIFEAAFDKPELRGMGTTLTAMLVDHGRAHVVHAGDSRCYLFRDGAIKQLTDDHSWIAEQLRSGAISESEAKSSKFRHVITRSIGFDRDIDADMKTVPVADGDCFVLCSDGLSNYVDAQELEKLIATTWYRKLPETLVELANQRGGDDNITVVVGLIANAPPAAPVSAP